MKGIVSLLMTFLVMLMFNGCATTGKPKAPAAKQTVTLSCVVPTLETVDGYPWEQTKDNVTINLVPTPFENRSVYERTLQEKIQLFTIGDQKTYMVTERPHHYVIRPDSLELALHLVNNLSHVLRLHGAVLSLSADGKNLPLDPRTQEELLKAVLTPYASLDVIIMGPSVKALENVNTLTFSIYDVITEVDAANNPTKRTTFEWIFSVRPKNIKEDLEVREREEKMTPIQASNMPRYAEME